MTLPCRCRPSALATDDSWLATLLAELASTLRSRIRSHCTSFPTSSLDDTPDLQAMLQDGSYPISDRLDSALSTRSARSSMGTPVNQTTVKSNKRHIASLNSSFSPVTLLDSEVSQVSLVATRLHWTAVMVWGLEQMTSNRHGLRTSQQEIANWASKLVTVVSLKRRRRSGLQRARGEHLLALVSHLRDLTTEITTSRCRDVKDFGWLKHLRYK